MRTIVLGILILAGFGSALSSGRIAVMMFNWVTFFRPQDFDWSFWTTKPLFQIAAMVLIVSNLFHSRLRFRMTPFLALFLIYFAWILIGCFLAFDTKISWAYFKAFFIPFPILFLVLTACVRSLQDTKAALWAMAGSLGLVAFKTGAVFTLKGGGHITEQINGFVGDNNVLALSVCLVASILMGLRSTLPKARKYRIAFFLFMSQVVLVVLYTQSRGAFVTLGILLLISTVLSKRRIRNTLALLLVAGGFYAALPKSTFSRLETFENVQEDKSAMGRVEMWKKAMRQAEIRPLFGVGVGGFRNFNLANWANEFPDGGSLVTHSVYFQVLSTTGYVGLLLYLSMMGCTFWSLHKSFRLAQRNQKRHPSLRWVATTSYWMRNGFLSYAVGSGFLDMLVYDVPWYFMLYGNLIYLNLRPALARLERNRKRQEAEAREAEEESRAAEDPAPGLQEPIPPS